MAKQTTELRIEAELLAVKREIEERARARLRVDQRLDEELQDTFPASDALSVTRGAKWITSGPLILPSDD